MAHGPSRRGGGGRSFSGRSSSHSFSSSRSSHSFNSSRSRSSWGGGPTIINTNWGGGRVVVRSSSSGSPLGFVFVIMLISIIVFFAMISPLSNSSAQLNYMKQDSVEYNEIINGAKSNNPKYKYANATIKDVSTELYYEGEEYYMIEYEFYNELSSSYMSSSTYYCYTYHQILTNNYKVGKTIKIAYSATESINSDYKMECADYFAYKNETKIYTIGILISLGVCALCVLIFVIYIKKLIKNKKLKTESATISNETTAEKVDTNTYCEYCGGVVTGETRCPCCGAKVKKNK